MLNKNKNNKKNTDIVYNSEFLCTYKSFDNEHDSNLCYQIQMLQAFNMLKYDSVIINNRIETCYNYLSNHEEIKSILNILLEKCKNTNLTFINNNIILFQLFFSYNYFDVFHKCFSNYLNNYDAEMHQTYFDELKKYIKENSI